jgi:hypothetical protein
MMTRLRRTGAVPRLAVASVASAMVLMACLGQPALAQGRGELLSVSPDSPDRIEALGRDVERAESLRQIKNLQILYTQFAQFGLWDEIGGLVSDDVELVSNDTVAFKGRADFVKHLKDEFSGGKEGLAKGHLHTDLVMQPVVILSYDGNSATARWTRMSLDGQFGGSGGGKASITGGMQLNDYVKQGGVWKLARIHYYPQYSGPYETGFYASRPNLPLVPYTYTPGQAGRPVPDQPSGVDRSRKLSLEDSEHRVDVMNDANAVRNLQNIYGYYIDRKMWSDVIDLFADDGVLEIAGQGIWSSPKSIRRELERDGPEGLKRGQANDHIQMNAIVTVSPSGTEARARGLELGMLSPKLGEAYWSASIFDNRFIKGTDGKWRVREMRLYPVMRADYYQGWGKSNIVEPKPGGAAAPDKPSAPDNSAQTGNAIPVFDFPNPGTGKAIVYPEGAHVVSEDRLLPAPQVPLSAAPRGSVIARMAEVRRKLDTAKAYDAVENVSNNFGYYLDDTMWDQMAEGFAVDGTRPQGPGFYVGHQHILEAMTQTHFSGPPSPTNPRDHLNIHQRLQPVIDINPDGSTAKLRTRLFLYHASQKDGPSSTFSSGMYPNETFTREGGVWKMQVGGEIDETYISSSSWKDGWAKLQERPSRAGTGDAGWRPGMPAPLSGITNTIDFPPDIPRTVFDTYRWKGMQATNWPEIKPMWFAYRNPITGRTPPNYCADILKCGGY